MVEREHKTESEQLTDAEAQLYDRQIRLWGLESQKRLRSAKILIIGMGGLSAEVAKNIILAGVKSVTFLDHKTATEADTFSQFFIPLEKLGENRATASLPRAKELNSLVDVTAQEINVSEIQQDFFLSNGPKWDVVVATGLPASEYARLDEICRKNSIHFYSGDTFGMFGSFFVDLNKFNFVDDVVTIGKPGEKTVTSKSLNLEFPSFTDAFETDFKKDDHKGKMKKIEGSFFLMKILMDFRKEQSRDPEPEDIETLKKSRDDLCFNLTLPKEKLPDELIERSVGASLSPVCAVLGAVLAQEIVKSVSRKGTPHQNMFFFNPVTNLGHVLHVPNKISK